MCGIAGLEGRCSRIDIKEFKPWIVRSKSQHDDSVAAVLQRKIDSSTGSEQRDLRMWREHLHLYRSKDNKEYILCERGISGGIVNV